MNMRNGFVAVLVSLAIGFAVQVHAGVGEELAEDHKEWLLEKYADVEGRDEWIAGLTEELGGMRKQYRVAEASSFARQVEKLIPDLVRNKKWIEATRYLAMERMMEAQAPPPQPPSLAHGTPPPPGPGGNGGDDSDDSDDGDTPGEPPSRPSWIASGAVRRYAPPTFFVLIALLIAARVAHRLHGSDYVQYKLLNRPLPEERREEFALEYLAADDKEQFIKRVSRYLSKDNVDAIVRTAHSLSTDRKRLKEVRKRLALAKS